MAVVKDPVNLTLGDMISSYAGKLTRTTHKNSIWVDIDEPNEHFRSEISFNIIPRMSNVRMIIGPDGNGTKPLVTDAAGFHNKSSSDLIAMTAGDITRSGGCPVVFTNVLDVSKLGDVDTDESFLAAKSLFDGLVKIANDVGFACLKGETAELSVCVSSPNPNAILKYNWSGFMVGITHPDKRITGGTLKPGQIIVALKENGFRSNGLSRVRSIMETKFGPTWWDQKELIEAIAEPSVVYDKFLMWDNGWLNKEHKFEAYTRPHLIVHLSGGSFKTKLFEDILKPKGLSAVLNDLWEPPTIVKQIVEWGGLKDMEIHEKLSAGQGALVVLNERDVNQYIRNAAMFGLYAKAVGEITQEKKPSLSIRSMFTGDHFQYY